MKNLTPLLFQSKFHPILTIVRFKLIAEIANKIDVSAWIVNEYRNGSSTRKVFTFAFRTRNCKSNLCLRLSAGPPVRALMQSRVLNTSAHSHESAGISILPPLTVRWLGAPPGQTLGLGGVTRSATVPDIALNVRTHWLRVLIRKKP